MNPNPTYRIHFAKTAPRLEDVWDDSAWSGAETAEITHFRPESSSHHPRASARLLHSETGIHGIFQVYDQYISSVRTRYMDEVWKDACVEVFFQPRADQGYFNFEMNCGGALVSNHIVDPSRTATGGLKDARPLPWELARNIRIHPKTDPLFTWPPPEPDNPQTMGVLIHPEFVQPLCWELSFFIPFSVFESYIGPLGALSGARWRGNFFKCAEDNSHPHWASWSPVDAFNFHLPHCFGELVFE